MPLQVRVLEGINEPTLRRTLNVMLLTLTQPQLFLHTSLLGYGKNRKKTKGAFIETRAYGIIMGEECINLLMKIISM